MDFIPFEDCVKSSIEGSVDGQQTINTLWFRSTIGPRTAIDVADLATSLRNWYSSFMCPILNEAFLGRRVTCRGMTNPNGFVAVHTMLGDDGGVSGEAAPNNCTMAVSFQTGLAGRSYHGRNYIPVLTNSEVTGNFIDAGFATSVVDAYSELVFGGSALPDGWIWIVASSFANNEPRPVGVFHEVMSVQVSDLVVDSQRRRLPGRGR